MLPSRSTDAAQLGETLDHFTDILERRTKLLQQTGKCAWHGAHEDGKRRARPRRAAEKERQNTNGQIEETKDQTERPDTTNHARNDE